MNTENELLEEAPPDTTCYLCGHELVNGVCPAYHWHDGKHLENRKLLARHKESEKS